MKTRLLSWLLFHANHGYCNAAFYEVKNRLLKKYGTTVGRDVQFIAGTKCHVCGGTGVYHGYSEQTGFSFTDVCNRCWGGWYKRPVWSILAIVKFGKHEFHMPLGRVYEKPELLTTIMGYVSHGYDRYSRTAKTILFLFYDRLEFRHRMKEIGVGWRICWWLPRTWPNNFVHLLRYGYKAIPVRRFMQRFDRRIPQPMITFGGENDEVPF